MNRAEKSLAESMLLRRRIEEPEAELRTAKSTIVAAAETAERALTQLLRCQPLIEAAQVWRGCVVTAPYHAAYILNLADAVDEFDKGRSS